MSTQKAMPPSADLLKGYVSVVEKDATPERPNGFARTRSYADAFINRPGYQAAGLTLAFQAVGVMLGAVNNLLIAKLFGVNGRGVISFMQMIAMYVGTVPFNFGLGLAGAYYISRGKDNRDIEPTVFWTSLVLGFIPCLLLLSPQFLAGRASEGMSFPFACAAVGVISPLVVAWNLGYIIIASDRVWLYNVIRITTPLGLCAALVYILASHQANLAAFVVIWSLSNVVPAAISIGFRWKNIGMGSFKLRLLTDLVKFGGISHLSNLLQMLCDRADLIFVAFLLPIHDLGIYTVATTMSEVMRIVPQSISPVLLPLVARTEGVDRGEKTTGFLVVVVGLCTLAGFLVAAGSAFLIPRFLPAFIPSVRLTWILLPGVLVSTIARIISTDLIGRGLPQLASWPPICGIAVYLLIGIPAISRFHLIGAAISSDLAYTAACLASLSIFVMKVKKRRGLLTYHELA